MGKLKSTPEGDKTVLDSTTLVYVHEHAEANDHKNNGLALLVAGQAGKLATGTHTKTTGTIGDLYWTVADELVGANLGKFPTASRKVPGLVG